MEKNHYTVNELAKRFGVKPGAIYQRLQKRIIPGFKYNIRFNKHRYLIIIPAWFAEKFTQLGEVDK